MKKVTKVMLFAWRKNRYKPEFFALNRKRGDIVVLTGHVGDHIPDESLISAAKREINEELGIDPLEIIDLKFKSTVRLISSNNISTEHTFLIKIPDNIKINYQNGKEKHIWYSIDELIRKLTYPHQKEAAKIIKNKIESD